MAGAAAHSRAESASAPFASTSPISIARSASTSRRSACGRSIATRRWCASGWTGETAVVELVGRPDAPRRPARHHRPLPPGDPAPQPSGPRAGVAPGRRRRVATHRRLRPPGQRGALPPRSRGQRDRDLPGPPARAMALRGRPAADGHAAARPRQRSRRAERRGRHEANGMPSGTRIGHVHLNVAELSAAEDFYAGLLGFEVTVRGYPGALFFATGGYHHQIGVNTWAGRGSGGAPARLPRAALVRDRAPGRAGARAGGAAPSRRGVRDSERRGRPAGRRSLRQRHPAHVARRLRARSEGERERTRQSPRPRSRLPQTRRPSGRC